MSCAGGLELPLLFSRSPVKLEPELQEKGRAGRLSNDVQSALWFPSLKLLLGGVLKQAVDRLGQGHAVR